MMTPTTKGAAGKGKKNVHFETTRTMRSIMITEGRRDKSKLQILIERVHRSGMKFMETSYQIDKTRNRFHRSGKIYKNRSVNIGKNSRRNVKPERSCDESDYFVNNFGGTSIGGTTLGGTTISLHQPSLQSCLLSPQGMTVWKEEPEGDSSDSDSTLGESTFGG
jgi:hypothetical protein